MRRLLFSTIAALCTLVLVSSAQAAGPKWQLESTANTYVARGEQLEFLVYLDNEGDVATSGEYHVLAQLPEGLVAKEAHAFNNGGGGAVTCQVEAATLVRCSGSDAVEPFDASGSFGIRDLYLTVEATQAAAGILTTTFTASGGGAATETIIDPTRVSSEPTPFGIDAFDFGTIEESGKASTTAATHPFANLTNLEFNLHTKPGPIYGPRWAVEPVRDITVALPPGMLGNPQVMGQCTLQQLIYPGEFSSRPACPARSQVGLVWLRTKGATSNGSVERAPVTHKPVALYEMTPSFGTPARFGFDILGTSVILDAKLRGGGDYGVSIVAPNIPAALVVQGNQIEFWGNPASESHDSQRSCPETYGPPSDTAPADCPAKYIRPAHQTFLRNPTSCVPASQGLTTTMRADSWLHPGSYDSKSVVSHEAPGFPLPDEPSTFPSGYSGPTEWGPVVGIEECGNEPFSPTFTATPTTEEADSPTGLDVQITMPQVGLEEETATSESDLKKTVVTLPEGMSVDSASANGQAACAAAQIGYKPGTSHPYEFSEAPQSCPDASKIGTVELESPLLKEGEGGPDRTLKGAVYLAKQSDNPFGSLLALYLVVEDEQLGVTLKLPGRVIANEQTGQLETVFDENPQLPFEHLRLHLFGGPRAALKTPPTCGTYETAAVLTGWSGAIAEEEKTPFTLDKGPGGGACPSGAFNPKLEAGTENPLAGQTSPFSLRLTREDGTQELSGLTVTLPPGLSGYLKGIPYCPDSVLNAISGEIGSGRSQEASPSCPAASQVGTATVGAGAGPTPFYTSSGRAYLAGPYKGAPLSLAVVAPAVAGPFDLGNVVVRNALQVNPETAQITAVSDPLPTILHGIPLDLRDVRVNLDRNHFTLNPTSCEPMSIASTITGTGGATASPSVRFQAADCAHLGFAPKLTITLKGKTSRGAHPVLKATLTMPAAGQANIARAQVTLPHAEFLDNAHVRDVCTHVQFEGEGCPKSSTLGYAKAWSPLLDQPLAGPVYLMSGFGHKLPDVAADLNGQIRVLLHGKVDTGPGGGIRNTFEVVPDAPVTKFTLSLKGGSRGLIQNSEDVCAKPQLATALFDAQNGKIHDTTPVIATGCGAKARKGKRTRHRR